MTPALDTIIGDYKVIGIAGSGGAGTVYKIEHRITKRIEAMKLLPGALGADPEQAQRFEREIQVQARLHHPNIAALYTAIRHESTNALVMEYVEGESLQRMLEAGPLPIHTALDFAAQVLSALAYAHSEGVIHRDVAPANIIITHDRTAKLTDFGLARGLNDPRITTNGAPLGSPWYMSPEQVRNVADVDARTDIYALGAVLYELLTGARPFDADNAFAVMRAHVESTPAAPSTHNRAISPALDAAILKALAKDPAHRFQSAAEFRQALDLAHPFAKPAAAPSPAARIPPPLRPIWFIPLMSAPVVLVAAIITVAILKPPKHAAARVAPPALVAPILAAQPAPVAPPEPAPDPIPAHSVAVAPQPVPARTVRRASAPAPAPPSSPIRISGGEVQAATVIPSPPPIPAPAPANAIPVLPAPQPEAVVALPDAPPPVTDQPAAAPQKPGNRLVRALGKINPFKKKNQ